MIYRTHKLIHVFLDATMSSGGDLIVRGLGWTSGWEAIREFSYNSCIIENKVVK
jgi:hypothetical protein